MKPILLLSLTLACGTAWAGEIYGVIVHNGQPVGGKRVVVKVGSEEKSTITDPKSGAYGVELAKAGRGTITIDFAGATVVGRVTSQAGAVQYDFEVVQSGSEYQLKRR